MKYELQKFEYLITARKSKIERDGGFDALEDVKNEVERIKQTLVYEVFNFKDKRHRARYIQYHQQVLIRLLDKPTLLANVNIYEGAEKAYYNTLYNALNELLAFIERHFTKYFDQDSKPPEGYITIMRNDCKVNIERFQKFLTSKNADPRLINLILHVFKKVTEQNNEHTVTYRQIMYAKEVQKELTRLLKKYQSNDANIDLNEELRHIMYYVNYNSIKVITYHAHYISALLEGSETRSEKIEKLSFVLKKINQAYVKPGISYNRHAPTLKNQFSDYLTEELVHQERLQRRSIDPPDGGLLEGFKLKFGASVSQVAYLIKIFIDTKIILNNNITQILQFIVRFSVTKRSETVSYASIRSKFYNVENGTKESVRSMLLSMIHYIDKN